MARPRSELSRTKALDSALHLAVVEGLAAVTMDDVARRSGVAKSTLYRHFGTRNGLLVAALDRIIQPPLAPDQGSLEADLVSFLASVQPIFANPSIRALAFEIYAAALRDPELDALRHTFFSGRMGPLMSVVERAQARGELGPDVDMVEAVMAIEGPFMLWSLTDAARIDAADPAVMAREAAHALRSAQASTP